jgi:hypothetical protein
VTTELLAAVQRSIEQDLSTHQREVLAAIVSALPPNEPGRLLARLTGPTGPELSCDECFEQLDLYVELELTTSDADAAIQPCERISKAAQHARRTARVCAPCCAASRGSGATTVTSALHGLVRDDSPTRDEFLSLTGGTTR